MVKHEVSKHIAQPTETQHQDPKRYNEI